MEKGRDSHPGPSRSPTPNRTEVEGFGTIDGLAPARRRRSSEVEVEKPALATDDDSSGTSPSVTEDEDEGHMDPSAGPGPGHSIRTMRSISEVRDGIENRRDVESGQPLEKQPTPRRLADPDLVTFDDDDPGNPKTWKFSRKWAAVFVVSTFTLISPISSTMTAPALNAIGAELNMTTEFEKELSLSIFVLGKDHIPFPISPYLLIPSPLNHPLNLLERAVAG